MFRIRQFRWDIGSVLPEDVRLNLSEQEVIVHVFVAVLHIILSILFLHPAFVWRT